jgi:hypothetical protein
MPVSSENDSIEQVALARAGTAGGGIAQCLGRSTRYAAAQRHGLRMKPRKVKVIACSVSVVLLHRAPPVHDTA